MRRVITATLAMLAVGLVATASANADATIYSGYDRVGTVKRSYSGWKVYDTSYSLIGTVRRQYGGAYGVYESYSKVGTIRRSYGSRFNVYAGSGYSRLGYVRRAYGSKWNAYEGYSSVGYATGTDGMLGAAALLIWTT